MISPHDTIDPCDQALFVLSTESDLTAAEISHRLKDLHGVDVHWRTVQAALSGNKSMVSRRKRAHKWRYTILEAGRRRLDGGSRPVQLVDPAKALQNVVTLHDILADMKGPIRVCDPYLDEASIEHLDSCAGDIRYLTHNINDSGRLRRTIAAASKPGRLIEIRTTKKSVLHDRYIIDKKSMLILGTSLNGFGKKQCFLIKAGQDMRETMLAAFDDQWNSAEKWS